jgi:hypothetical protein
MAGETIMDTQSIINLAGGAVLAAIGWFARTIYDAVNELRKDIHDLEVDIPKRYVAKDDFNITMKHIEDMFQRIYDKIDEKADKR